MPSYEFDYERGAFVKECSSCHEVVIGAVTDKESFELFLVHYAVNNGDSEAADGLQSRCRACNSHNRRKLGITKTILEEMYKDCGGMCPICKKEISLERTARPINKANVDHDEETGKIRGLLCGECNRGIGTFKHNIEFLEEAIAYLRRFRCDS